jgi:diguanylate cyclase (GGDEF)-like protein/PAS domain S-box-containing protein
MKLTGALSLPRPGPVARLSFGLVSLIISLVLAFDLFFGVLPTRFETQRELRSSTAGSIGVQVAMLLERDDRPGIESAFAKTLAREREIRSLALRRRDGQLAVATAAHEQHWLPPPEGKSTLNHVRIPLYADGRPWGDMEVSFEPVDATSFGTWLREPLFVLVAALATVGLGLVFLYMRRSLQFLDPTSAVPERVRQAFDTFVDAVVIVDGKGRMVLANEALRRLWPATDRTLYGKPLSTIPWLMAGAAEEQAPWLVAMRNGRAVAGLERELPARTDGEPGRALLSCSPIVHQRGGVRGCLVALHDVTDLRRSNDQLRAAMHELERSRREIEAKNVELHQLATRDGLTGCLNRRAFSEAGIKLFERLRAEKRVLACLMIDIDHFKSVNDRLGHSTGDKVIQLVATALMKQLRADDVLCRYGGEEFCLLLPDVGARQAKAVAERLRDAIEANVGRGLRLEHEEVITASVGVTATRSDTSDLEHLINTADAALYESKRRGRNRVTMTV